MGGTVHISSRSSGLSHGFIRERFTRCATSILRQQCADSFNFWLFQNTFFNHLSAPFIIHASPCATDALSERAFACATLIMPLMEVPSRHPTGHGTHVEPTQHALRGG